MKTFGGGEDLRAVLESNAVDSMPFFYNAMLTGANGQAPAFSVQSATIQTERDSIFLLTSLWGISSNAFINQPEYLGIFDASRSKVFVDGGSHYYAAAAPNDWFLKNTLFAGLINDSLASCVTLPEYMLWGPSSLIGVAWLGRNGSSAKYRYFTLGGIKYHLKGK
jgi:hypothetical protein